MVMATGVSSPTVAVVMDDGDDGDDVVGVVAGAGQVAVYSTAESWAFLHPLKAFKQVFFLVLTLSDSFRALQAIMSTLAVNKTIIVKTPT